MKRQQWIGFAIVIFALLSIITGWWLVPRLLGSLPGGVQGRLPLSLYAALHTPLPAELPPPRQSPESLPPTIIVPTAITVTPSELSNSIISDHNDADLLGGSGTAYEDAVSSQPALLPESIKGQSRLPSSANIAGLDVIAQKFNNCGPANLTMVLNYYGHEADQIVIGEMIKPNYEDRNVSPHELVSYVNENSTIRAMAFRGGDILLLKKLLAADFPVIIEKGLWLDVREGWMGHYLTLFGYDDGEQSFNSMDSFLGPWDNTGRLVSYEEVSEKWHQFNNLFIVLYPIEQEEELRALIPAEMLDPVSMWQKAAQDAQLLLGETEADAFTWFNLAASLTHLGELTGEVSHFESAAIAFDRARELGLPWRMLWYQFEPYQAYLVAGRIDDVKLLTEVILIYEGGRNIEETYLYRGHALLTEGDREGAIKAYQKALRLNPSMDSAEAALDLIN